MRPFDSDRNWRVIYDGGRLNTSAMQSILRAGLVEAYHFTATQADLAAQILVTGTRDPSTDRKRLEGRWSQIDQRGHIGFGEFSRTVSEYNFGHDFRYAHYSSTTSSYTSPPGAPLLMRSPTLVEERTTGVYLVAARSDDAVVCLCADNGQATSLQFSFDASGRLFIRGLGLYSR
jgi:hypothetical protein